MLCLYRGFDGLDVSFAARISHELSEELEIAKRCAQEHRKPTYLRWGETILEVAESGAKGGYAFRCATGGELGVIWFFKKPSRGDPWGVRASCRSFGLATKGLGGMRAELHSLMRTLDVRTSQEGESIGRVDYAVDFLLPDFTLIPENFVMHSNATRRDHFDAPCVDVSGSSGRVTSVTVGRMPGRQTIVYDKRAETLAHGKAGWWTIWNAALEGFGLPPINPSECEPKVWRVELRAGKKHLKERWGIRTWEDLDNQFAPMIASSLDAIRYATPTSDTNRSRWPNSQLWMGMQRETSQDLFEMTCAVPPNLVRTVQLKEHDRLLASQMVGLLTSRAALHSLSPCQMQTFGLAVGKEMSARIADAPEHFEKKLANAKARFNVCRD